MSGKEVRAGKAFVEIALRDNLAAGLKRAASQLRAFASMTTAIGAGLTGASAAILGPLTAAVYQFSEVGDSVAKMAARTGMSAEAVSELAHAASLSGTDVETLENGVRRMQQTLVEAASGNKSAAESLARLGLSAESLRKMSPDQQLAAIADRIAKIQNPAQRTAAAMDIFGRAGTQLLPMLSDGSAGLAAMRDQARALGLSISSDTAKSAEALNDALGTMWSTVKALTFNIGAALAPIVTNLADQLSELVGKVIHFVRANQGAIGVVAIIAVAIGAVGVALVGLGGALHLALLGIVALGSLWAATTAAMLFLPRTLGRIVRSVAGTLSGMVTDARKTVNGWSAAWTRAQKAFASWHKQVAARAATIKAALEPLVAGAAAVGQRMVASLTRAAEVAFSRLQQAARGAALGVSASFRWVAATAPGVWSRVTSVATRESERAGQPSIAHASMTTYAAQQWQRVASAGQQVASRVTATWQRLPAWVREPLARIASMAGQDARRATVLIRAAFAQVPGIASAAWQQVRAVGVRAATSVAGVTRSVMQRAFAMTQAAGAAAFGRVRRAGIGAMRSVLSTGAAAPGKMLGAFASVGAALTMLLPGAGGVVGTLLTALPLVASAVGAVGAALLSLLTPVGLVAAAVIGGIVAWTAWTTEGQQTLGALKQVFGSLWQVTSKVLGGLGDALAAGDMQLAARILWAGLKAIWYTGIDELNKVWPTLQSAASAVWQQISQIAATAATYVAGIWAQLPQWLTGPLASIGQVFGTALGWIGEQFSQLAAWAGETFSAIGAALAQGDFALAGEIAWASIKLAFAQGIAWVTNAWTEFTTGLSSIWDGMVTYLRQIWNDVVSWLAKSILQLVGSVQSALDVISKYDPTGLADKLKQQMSVDVEGAIRTVEEDRARFNQSQDVAKGQRDDERVRAMQDQLAATEAQLAELRAAREAALAKSKASADKAGPAGSPLAKAMDELEKALDDAANAKKRLFDPAAADQQMTGVGDLTSQFASTGSLAGTFSASVAAMLGRSGDDPAERTAEAVESMDGTLTDIRDDLRGRPMLAFDE